MDITIIDEYIATQSEDVQDILWEIRNVIKEAASEATERRTEDDHWSRN